MNPAQRDGWPLPQAISGEQRQAQSGRNLTNYGLVQKIWNILRHSTHEKVAKRA